MRKFFYILIGIFAIFMVSCEGSTGTTTTTSSVAKLSTFAFASNDSFPGLAKATFTIEERLDTGLVWNPDSMLFGTRLDSVVPRFTFAATPSAAFLRFPDTTVYLTGYDTLNFNQDSIFLTIRSSDKTTIKTYEIRATVHQVDPDLYVWEELCESVYPLDGRMIDSEQRVVLLGDQFVMLASNGFEMVAYASADGRKWTTVGEPTGLPLGTKVRQIICDSTTLYYGQDSVVYTSTDAINWTAHNVDHTVVTMLMSWNKAIWALATIDDQLALCTFSEEGLKDMQLYPAGNFPISDFASVVFQNPSGRNRAQIIGGFASSGQSLNTRWNLEYSEHIHENGGYRLEEYSIDRPDFTSLTGISVVAYNKQLLLFGGVDDEMQYLGREIFISTDEGLNWYSADSTKNQLPEAYQARQKQSAIVRDNYIYLFGGQDSYVTYSDVYRGRLNSIDW